ncbi:MAG: MYXO-CTERM sorting domain-containing protein [Candidatus Thermoplasmatota archaeon]
MNKLTTLGLAAVAVLVLIPAAQAAHSVTVSSGDAKAGEYTMTVNVSDNFKLVDFNTATEKHKKGEGHIHYLINDKAAPGDYATTSKSFTFKDLKAGDKVSAELVLSDHTASGTNSAAVLDGSRVLSSVITVGSAGAPGAGPLLVLGLLALAGVVARRKA